MPTAQASTAAGTTVLTTARQSSQLLQLLRSVLRGSARDLRRYLARGGNPNARVYKAHDDGSFYASSEDYTGPSAVVVTSLLAICCLRRWAEQINLLVGAGADVNSDSGTSLSPMCTAAARGDIATMVMLETMGAHVNSSGDTPLMIASAYGRLEAAKWLVSHGADVARIAAEPEWLGRQKPSSAMLTAAGNGHVNVMRFLHAHGAVFALEAGGQMHTALHESATAGHDECVRFIVACGFPANAKETGGLTPLHIASQHGHQAIIEQLLDAGADIEVKDDNAHTPLTHAMALNKPEVVVLLIARGALVHDGRAASIGVSDSSIAALHALMTSPQWLAMSRTERLQAECGLLHYVRDKATLEAVRSLALDMLAPVLYRMTDGNNALHTAAYLGKAVPLICALIKEGVDPTVANNAGQLPADKAREAGHTLQATLLERAADDKRKRDLLQQQEEQKHD